MNQYTQNLRTSQGEHLPPQLQREVDAEFLKIDPNYVSREHKTIEAVRAQIISSQAIADSLELLSVMSTKIGRVMGQTGNHEEAMKRLSGAK